ncbi:MAG: hypothetical protein ACRBN8_47005 [Nannocystales bacterium]
MKRRDRDKLRRLDPALASQLEGMLARREAETLEETPESCCEAAEADPMPREAGAAPSAPTEARGGNLKGPALASEEPPENPVETSEPTGDLGGSSRPVESEESCCEGPQTLSSTDVVDAPHRGSYGESFAEGYQEPLLPLEEFEVDGQTRLFSGGSVAPAKPEPETPAEEVDALLAKLQRALPFEDGDKLPDCKRSAEELSLLTWQEKSTRREDETFEHPPELDAELRGMSDPKLGEAWGWVNKRRYRGLSARDLAVQREVYARSLGMLDLYGLDRQPAVSAMMTEVLRSQGCRSAVALYIVALLELMLVKGRWTLRLSASDAYTLKGCAASTWWAAVARLEEMGILQRMRSVKSGEHGPAPVQRSTNLYILGPWWTAGEKDGSGAPKRGTTPLEQALGLLNKCIRREDSPAAAAAHRKTLAPRKARRRRRNEVNRDRNRKRHRGLPPRVTTTPDVVRAAEVLARARLAEEEAAVEAQSKQRAQALLRGDFDGLSLGEPPPALELPVWSSEAAEVAAAAQVGQANRGEPEGAALRREVASIRGVRRAVSEEPRSQLVNCRPVSGRQSRRGRPKEKFVYTEPGLSPEKRPSRNNNHLEQPPPHAQDRADLTTKAGDKSGSEHFLCVRARALDEVGPAKVFQHDEAPASLQEETFVRQAFEACFGREMPD